MTVAPLVFPLAAAPAALVPFLLVLAALVVVIAVPLALRHQSKRRRRVLEEVASGLGAGTIEPGFLVRTLAATVEGAPIEIELPYSTEEATTEEVSDALFRLHAGDVLGLEVEPAPKKQKKSAPPPLEGLDPGLVVKDPTNLVAGLDPARRARLNAILLRLVNDAHCRRLKAALGTIAATCTMPTADVTAPNLVVVARTLAELATFLRTNGAVGQVVGTVAALPAAEAGPRCPYCHSGFVEATPPVACASCNTLHHQECFEKNGRCTTMGCGGDKAVASKDRGREAEKA